MAELPILRTGERAAFKHCPQKWWWAYRMGLKPRDVQADAFWFGIGIHQALAEWYLKGKRRGPHPADTWLAWAGDEIAYAKTYLGDTFDEPVWEKAQDLGTAMLEAYVDHYGKDPQWSIIAIEYPFEIRIERFGKPIIIFSSRWDGVERDEADGRIYLLEHKTAAQISTAYLEGDEQAGSYLAVASAILRANGTLGPKEEIAGIQYNFLRKARPDERPTNEQGLRLNQNGQVSKRQPPPLFVRPEPIERSQKEQRKQLERIADEVSIMNLVRSRDIPVIKNRTRDCPRCVFWTMCLLHERGGNAWEEVMRADFQQQDPYLENRKSASG